MGIILVTITTIGLIIPVILFGFAIQMIINDSGWPYFPMAIPGKANWETVPFGLEIRDLYHSIYGKYYFPAYLFIITFPCLLVLGLIIVITVIFLPGPWTMSCWERLAYYPGKNPFKKKKKD